MKKKWLLLILIPILLTFVVGFDYLRTVPQELVENQNVLEQKTQQINNQKAEQEVPEPEQLTQVQNSNQTKVSTQTLNNSVQNPIETEVNLEEDYNDSGYCPNGYCQTGTCPYSESGYCPGNGNRENCPYYNPITGPGNGSGFGNRDRRGHGCCS